jgi:hypothetical protein
MMEWSKDWMTKKIKKLEHWNFAKSKIWEHKSWMILEWLNDQITVLENQTIEFQRIERSKNCKIK